jgi:DHA1 family bicyclomycin/chloramphenicol resistance-like MFS transporter
MSPFLIVVTLSLLLGLQTVTTDLYLPALPTITEGFGASMAQAQLTLTAMLLAFGISQLIWGPLSDRFGRRPILLWSLVAYVVAAVGSALAPTMAALIGWRIVQGATMGAGVMCARAIVRDLYAPVDGTRIMSKGLTGLGLFACLSGPIGGLLADHFGGHVTLMALAVFGAATLAVVAWRFEETVSVKNPLALRPATLVRTWWHIVRHPTFLSFSALATATYAGLFTFLAASSFVFIQVLGLSRTEYGLVMFSMPLSYIGGTFMCRHLLPRFGMRRTVAIAGAFSLAGGTLMGVLALAGLSNGWAIMLPFYLFMLAHGVHQPCGQSASVGPFPQAAGAASALNGFLMMLAAFVMGGWLGTHMDGTVRPLVYGVWFWSVLTALIAWTLVQKHGKTGEH